MWDVRFKASAGGRPREEFGPRRTSRGREQIRETVFYRASGVNAMTAV